MPPQVITAEKGLEKRLVFLDYLRIFSFISVLIGHKFYSQLSQWADSPTLHATPKLLMQLVLPAFWNGGTGVAVFFIISGYIISNVLITESTSTFLFKRIFRIYPLYIAALLCQLAVDHFLFHQPFPGMRVVLAQMTLLGDFLQAPYALSGVEWTLRIEIAFYLFMAALKSIGILNQYRRLLPWAMLAATWGVGLMEPIPSFNGVFLGYFTIYAPILFIGVYVTLFERKEINVFWFILFIGAILYQYFEMIALYWPTWLGSHFIGIAFAIFTAAWIGRKQFQATPLVLLLSNLTFSVYLFHNWAWNPIKILFEKLSLNILPADIQALFGLFIICYIMHKTVERKGIQLGNKLLKNWENRISVTRQDSVKEMV